MVGFVLPFLPVSFFLDLLLFRAYPLLSFCAPRGFFTSNGLCVSVITFFASTNGYFALTIFSDFVIPLFKSSGVNSRIDKSFSIFGGKTGSLTVSKLL